MAPCVAWCVKGRQPAEGGFHSLFVFNVANGFEGGNPISIKIFLLLMKPHFETQSQERFRIPGVIAMEVREKKETAGSRRARHLGAHSTALGGIPAVDDNGACLSTQKVSIHTARKASGRTGKGENPQPLGQMY
jgi:hypothetical protein